MILARIDTNARNASRLVPINTDDAARALVIADRIAARLDGVCTMISLNGRGHVVRSSDDPLTLDLGTRIAS